MAKQAASKGNPNWRKGMPSPNPTGKARSDSSSGVLPTSSVVHALVHTDAWQNFQTGLGVAGRDKSIGAEFVTDVVTGDEGTEIWRGDPIAARIVETLPNEALRQGYELCIGDDEPPDTFKPEPPQIIGGAAPQQGAPPASAARPRSPMSKADAWRRDHLSAYEVRVRAAVRRDHWRARRDAGEAKDLQEGISKHLASLGTDAVLKEAMCYERAGGGGAVLIGANDYTIDLREPLDLKRVRSLDWLTPLEARELSPLYWYNNPRAPKFGQPAIYQLTPYMIGAPIDGYTPQTTQIHESRLLIFPGIRVSRRLLNSGTFGWGDCVFTRVKNALRNFNMSQQSAAVLLSDFSQAIYKIKGLADVLGNDPMAALKERMLAVELMRSICRAIIVDGDEDFERKSTTMTGFPETMDRIAQYLAAAADMPLTLIMGTSPAGMNATGASDIRFFYDRVSSVQTLRVAPAILRLTEIELAIRKQNPDDINHSVKFKPLYQPTEKEIADAHLSQANADAVYLTNQVVSPEEMALSRFGGDQYSYETRLDFEARAAQEAIVAPPVDANPKPIIVGGINAPGTPDESGPMPAGSGKPTGAGNRSVIGE